MKFKGEIWSQDHINILLNSHIHCVANNISTIRRFADADIFADPEIHRGRVATHVPTFLFSINCFRLIPLIIVKRTPPVILPLTLVISVTPLVTVNHSLGY